MIFSQFSRKIRCDTTIIAKACAEVWQEEIKLIMKKSSDEEPIKEIIGTVQGKEIVRSCVSVITKSPKENPN